MFTAVAPAKAQKKSRAQKHRDREAKRSRDNATTISEIGPPPQRNEKLWKRYRLNLFLFLVERFPRTTGKKPFSDDHKEIIGKIQQTVIDGGQELIIWFRGSAK